MSAMGHNRTERHLGAMTALPPKADKAQTSWHVRANTGTRCKLSFDGPRGPHAPQAGPLEDDGKCAPYPSYPQLARRFLRGVDGCRHRSSQIQPHRLAREQASAEADCANPPRACLRVRNRYCTKKLRSCP